VVDAARRLVHTMMCAADGVTLVNGRRIHVISMEVIL
jgi:hypothetical protein